MSGATRAIIVNQARHPLLAYCQSCADFCTSFAARPAREKWPRRECQLCNLTRTTFSSANAYRADGRLNFPGKFVAPRDEGFLFAFFFFFAKSLLFLFARKREYYRAAVDCRCFPTFSQRNDNGCSQNSSGRGQRFR